MATLGGHESARFGSLVSSDLERYTGRPGGSWLSALPRCLSRPGILATLVVRAQQRLVARGLGRVAGHLRGVGVVLVGIDVAPGASIGRGVWFEHPVGVVIGNGVVIGEGVTVAQRVTLGARHPHDPHPAYPVVEDGATLGAGCTVLGGVTVGAGSVVAAGAVVLHDVPPGATVAGTPAVVVRTADA